MGASAFTLWYGALVLFWPHSEQGKNSNFVSCLFLHESPKAFVSPTTCNENQMVARACYLEEQIAFACHCLNWETFATAWPGMFFAFWCPQVMSPRGKRRVSLPRESFCQPFFGYKGLVALGKLKDVLYAWDLEVMFSSEEMCHSQLPIIQVNVIPKHVIGVSQSWNQVSAIKPIQLVISCSLKMHPLLF